MAYNRPDAESLVAAFASSDFSRDERAWNDAVAEDRGPDDLQIPEPDEDGNYSNSALDAIMDAMAAHEKGEMSDKEFLALLDRIQVAINDTLAVMDAFIQDGLDDARNPINESLQAGFEEHAEAVDFIRDGIKKKDNRTRSKGLLMVQQATNRIMDAYAFYQRLRNAVTVVFCPQCSAENKLGSDKCGSCHTALPNVVRETAPGRLLAEAADGVLRTESTHFIKTPNYERIEQAYQRWRERDITDEQFKAELEAVEANMVTHREYNNSEREDLDDLEADERALMIKFLDAVDDAIESNLQALNRMKLYFESHDPQPLAQGFDMLAVATTKMVEAYLAQEAMLNQPDEEPGGEE